MLGLISRTFCSLKYLNISNSYRNCNYNGSYSCLAKIFALSCDSGLVRLKVYNFVAVHCVIALCIGRSTSATRDVMHNACYVSVQCSS